MVTGNPDAIGNSNNGGCESKTTLPKWHCAVHDDGD
jgi:hypothetical protein